MRITWSRLRWLAGVGLGALGCWTTEPSLKPPPRPEVYATPPQDDGRFSEPIAYPKGTLNQGLVKKKDKGPDGAPGAPRLGTAGMTPAGY
jgi:hypothetical protein